MNPIDPRRSERALLASVHRWARTHGWHAERHSWRNGGPASATVDVRWGRNEIGVSRVVDRLALNNHGVWSCTTWIRVSSVVQAVDVLVALGILPVWLSSAYGLAEDRYREQVETLTEELGRARGAYAHVVAGWAERAEIGGVR